MLYGRLCVVPLFAEDISEFGCSEELDFGIKEVGKCWSDVGKMLCWMGAHCPVDYERCRFKSVYYVLVTYNSVRTQS